jgi:hypothetical protein
LGSGCFLGLLLHHDDGVSTFLRNIRKLPWDDWLLTAHLQLVPRSKTRGYIHPLPPIRLRGVVLNNYLSMALEPFVGSWTLFQFLDLLHSRQDSLDGGSAGRKAATYTGQHKHGINAHRHPYLNLDSNPRSQCLSGRRQFMP